jgi:dTDP-4-dehydrorhamnose 3,5-epimerase
LNETDLEIPGVKWGHVGSHFDERGAFRELWRASSFAGSDQSGSAPARRFVQANLSISQQGVLRGLHYHKKQLDYWVVLDGEVFVVLVDLRNMVSQKLPRPVTKVLTSDDTVTIPEMVAHGFLAIAPTSLLYFVTIEYDGTDELGLAWDDPELGVSWPDMPTTDRRPIVSARDRRNPSLIDFRKGNRSAVNDDGD